MSRATKKPEESPDSTATSATMTPQEAANKINVYHQFISLLSQERLLAEKKQSFSPVHLALKKKLEEEYPELLNRKDPEKLQLDVDQIKKDVGFKSASVRVSAVGADTSATLVSDYHKFMGEGVKELLRPTPMVDKDGKVGMMLTFKDEKQAMEFLKDQAKQGKCFEATMGDKVFHAAGKEGSKLQEGRLSQDTKDQQQATTATSQVPSKLTL